MKRIRRENANICKSNTIAILYTSVTSPDVIDTNNKDRKIKSTSCMNKAMVIRYTTIKSRDVVDVLADKYPKNKILERTG